jgi:hypothetical protein
MKSFIWSALVFAACDADGTPKRIEFEDSGQTTDVSTVEASVGDDAISPPDMLADADISPVGDAAPPFDPSICGIVVTNVVVRELDPGRDSSVNLVDSAELVGRCISFRWEFGDPDPRCFGFGSASSMFVVGTGQPLGESGVDFFESASETFCRGGDSPADGLQDDLNTPSVVLVHSLESVVDVHVRIDLTYSRFDEVRGVFEELPAIDWERDYRLLPSTR